MGSIIKKQINRFLALITVICLVFNVLPQNSITVIAMSQTDSKQTSQVTSNVTVEKDEVMNEESISVDIELTGIPVENVVIPNDVVLVLDCSGSMSSENRFDAMQQSANEFVDMIDFSVHRVGIVAYDTRVYTCNFSTDADVLHTFINAQSAGASTATDLAINAAVSMLSKKRSTAKSTVILLSDGYPDDMEKTLAAAEKAKKNNDLTIFTVALLSADADPDTSSTNKTMMQLAASSAHHFYVLGSQGLLPIYQEIVQMIGIANAQKVVVTQTLSSQFTFVEGSANSNIPEPIISGNTIKWSMAELREETLHLSYSFKAKEGIKSGTYPYISSGGITYKTVDGTSEKISFDKLSITVKHSPVVIETINGKKKTEDIDFGIAGDEQVVIQGENFHEKAVVKVGNTTISTSKRTIVDNNTIIFTMPSHSQGTDWITVINPSGETDSCSVNFKMDPIVSKVSPVSGPYEGGKQVKISCKYVMSGASITFDGVPAVVQSVKSSYVLVKTPCINKEGLVDIVITNPDGTGASIVDAYTYEPKIVPPAPEITNINKTEGLSEEKVQIKISGKNFRDGADFGVRMTATGGNEVVCDICSVKNTYVLCYVPAGTLPGMYYITVTNGDGTKCTYTDKTYTCKEKEPEPAPEITNINKTEGAYGVRVQVKINGSNFRNGTNFSVTMTDTSGNKILCDTCSVKNAYVLCYVPIGTPRGTYTITVTNDDGTTCTYTDKTYTVK